MKLSYPAQWHDGRSAAQHSVWVLTHVDELVIQDIHHAQLARWPLRCVRCTEEHYAGQPLRLQNRDDRDARLIVEDEALIDWLSTRIKGYHRTRDRHSLASHILIALLALIIVIGLAMSALPRAADPLSRLVPLRWEDALGEQIVSVFLRDAAVCDDSAGQAALDSLSARLMPDVQTNRRNQIWVIDDPTINALAAPGGNILVYRGLIDFAQSPDELAAILAHEFAHIEERHVLQGIIRDLGLTLVLSALIGDVSTITALAADAGKLMINLSYSRDIEAQADAIAYAKLQKAGLSGAGMQAFFQRLSQTHPQAPEWLSTHPQPLARAARFASLQGQPALPLPQWQAIKQMCTPVSNSR